MAALQRPKAGTAQYEQDMIDYQNQRAFYGMEYEPWDLTSGKGYSAQKRAQEAEYNQMLANADALRAQEAAKPARQPGHFTPEEIEFFKWAEANPKEFEALQIDNVAKQQAEAAQGGQKPVAPINPNQSGRQIIADEKEQQKTIEENKEIVEENTGYLGENLQQKPTTYASKEQIDEIRALQQKIANDTGGSLQFEDYGRMSVGEANDLLAQLKATAGWDESSGQPESGLYNPVEPTTGPENLAGPNGIEYQLPSRPEQRFPVQGGANPAQTAQAGALRGGLDFSQGNPFQGAAFDAGFKDFNTQAAIDQSQYNKFNPQEKTFADALRGMEAEGNMNNEWGRGILQKRKDNQAILDQRQAGWNAQGGGKPANTTGGTAMFPTYTGAA